MDDSLVDNSRGYFFITMIRSWEKWMQWDWGQAAEASGNMPHRRELLDDALAMWDALSQDIDTTNKEEVTQLAQAIRDEIAESIRISAQGAWGKTRNGKWYLKYQPLPELIDSGEINVATHEQGYREIEDRLDLEDKLRLLRPRLTDEQYNTLLLYVYGEADSMAEAVFMQGKTDKDYDRIRRQIRYASKGLEFV